MKHTKRNYYFLGILGVILGIFLDQFTKHLAVVHLKDQEPFICIPKVFQLHYLENRGAAFGMLQNQRFFFIVSFLIIMTVIFLLYRKLPTTRRFIPLHICAVLIVAGAIGNLIDRVRLGYVVDFFYFELIDFPIFNVADIFVVVGVILLGILIFFQYTEEEVDSLLSFHKKSEK